MFQAHPASDTYLGKPLKSPLKQLVYDLATPSSLFDFILQ